MSTGLRVSVQAPPEAELALAPGTLLVALSLKLYNIRVTSSLSMAPPDVLLDRLWAKERLFAVRAPVALIRMDRPHMAQQ